MWARAWNGGNGVQLEVGLSMRVTPRSCCHSEESARGKRAGDLLADVIRHVLDESYGASHVSVKAVPVAFRPDTCARRLKLSSTRSMGRFDQPGPLMVPIVPRSDVA